MPEVEPKKVKKPRKSPVPKEAGADVGLQTLLLEIQSEIHSLRDEVHQIKQSSEAHTISKTKEIEPEQAETIFEKVRMQIEGEPHVDPDGFALEIQEALAQPLIEEEEDPIADEEVEEIPIEPADGPLTQDEIFALLSAAEETLVATDSEVEAPLESNVAPQDEAEIDGGMALSDAEIQALIAQSSGTPPEPSVPQSFEEAAEIVSAAEIEAMLGLKDPISEMAVESTSQELEDVLSEPVIVEEDPIEIQVPQSQTHVSLGEIEPSAVAKVPGLLAAAALAVPVCVIDDQLHCLSVEPYDIEALGLIEAEIGLKLVPHPGELQNVLRELRTRYSSVDEELAMIRPEASAGSIIKKVVSKLLRRAI